MTLPKTLIEDWLPFDTVGAESLRDASAAQKPPLNRLHVWWARRPLTVSRAAIVASLLPAWAELAGTPAQRAHFPTEAAYRAWFTRLLGIYGDPLAAQKLIQADREGRITLTKNPYEHDRAFTVNPAPEDLALLEQLVQMRFDVPDSDVGNGGFSRSSSDPAKASTPQPSGMEALAGPAEASTPALTSEAGRKPALHDIVVLDPFAGGGSIPFEARRYGLSTVANELNPVAAVILKATLDYPARFGPSLAADIRRWGREWSKRVREKLASYFPKADGENIFAYLWARTVACPVTGKPAPLSPNWWLSKDPPIAVRLLTDPAWDEPRFEIYTPRAGGTDVDDPDQGTIARGVGRSPWTGDAIDGNYIKAEAQAGRMGQMLYAVALKRRGGFDFRAPTDEDMAAARAAEQELARRRPQWEAQEVIPVEAIPEGLKTPEPMRYGMYTWANMFSPRQLLAMGVFVETLREVGVELRKSMDQARAAAVETYLAIALNKAPNYNSRMSVWHALRTSIANTFNRHDFSFAWSHGEFDAAGNLLPWCVDQIYDAYKGLADLLTFSQPTLEHSKITYGNLDILQGNAADLSALPDASVHCIVTDPPYYDNVMYAELSDFFYVWLKRTAGHLYPQWFAAQLTDKDAEAVANPARFAGITRRSPPKGSTPKRGVEASAGDDPAKASIPAYSGMKGARAMAEQDYERKMEAAFREMHRVLRPDGVLTVMFTHKRVEAWDTLASALIGAGFTITASWPVHTESEHSLHQAKKNAARSTILLACRKRERPPSIPSASGGDERGGWVGVGAETVWWDDLAGRVRQVAHDKAAEFAARGTAGVDLYLSTFGPALAVISERWPVLTSEVDEKTGQPKPLRPETALDLARQEVITLRKRGLLLGREVQFDPLTDWYLMAWDAFKAERFPADEARKLALALGLDVERDLVARRVVGKTGSDVVMQRPKQRRVRGRVDPEADQFDAWLDAVHTALLVYEEDGAHACETFLKRTHLLTDSTFKACLQAMINAVPRTRVKEKFVRPEAEGLERLRAAFFDEIEVPPEEAVEERAEQLRLM